MGKKCWIFCGTLALLDDHLQRFLALTAFGPKLLGVKWLHDNHIRSFLIYDVKRKRKSHVKSALMHSELYVRKSLPMIINIPRKIQHFSPIQSLYNKRQQKWKSSFTLMMFVYDLFWAVNGYDSPNNDRRVAKIGIPTNFDIVVLIFLVSN